jgi:hypothetical protein
LETLTGFHDVLTIDVMMCFLLLVSDLGNGNQFPFPILEKHCVSDLGNGNQFPFPILERSWKRKPVSVSYFEKAETETSFRFLFWKRKPVSMMCLQHRTALTFFSSLKL